MGLSRISPESCPESHELALPGVDPRSSGHGQDYLAMKKLIAVANQHPPLQLNYRIFAAPRRGRLDPNASLSPRRRPFPSRRRITMGPVVSARTSSPPKNHLT